VGKRISCEVYHYIARFFRTDDGMELVLAMTRRVIHEDEKEREKNLFVTVDCDCFVWNCSE
jgi:hypothetical protein